MPRESTAIALTERLDALTEALRAAGIPQERTARLLAAAATATAHAAELDVLAQASRRRPAAQKRASYDGYS